MNNRTRARLNLQTAAVNAALEQRLITLECVPVNRSVYEFTVGGYHVVSTVFNENWDELKFTATVRPTEWGRRGGFCLNWRSEGEAVTLFWLERRTGKYLMTTHFYHGTREVTDRLGSLPAIEPRGFGLKPTKRGYDFHKELVAALGR